MLTINKIIHKLDSSKIKNFCSPKDTIKRVERKAKEWEKIFAIHVSGKGLISRIYKEFLKIDLKEKKRQTTNRTMGERLRHFTKQDTQMSYK